MKILKLLKKFWRFTWKDDSFLSYVSALLVSLIFIKFILFPGLSLIFQTDYPVVAIVSGSMEHKISDGRVCSSSLINQKNSNLNFEEYWNFCGYYYENNFNLNSSYFETFPFSSGLNIGDMMVLYGKKIEKIQVGDVLVFIPEDRSFYYNYGPVIHRVVDIFEEDGKKYFQTKGDHNPVSFPNFETKISEDDVLGVALVRVPYLGLPKYWLSSGIESAGQWIRN